MRISDWSSDVCSSDLVVGDAGALHAARGPSTSLWLVPLPRWGRICGAGGGGARSIGKLDVRHPIGELQRGPKTIREAGLHAPAADQAVPPPPPHAPHPLLYTGALAPPTTPPTRPARPGHAP